MKNILFSEKHLSLTELLEKTRAEKMWRDDVPVDRRIAESYKCPHCGNQLEYRGFANAATYHVFGVCEACDYAHKNYSEPDVFRSAKKRFSRRRNRVRAGGIL